MKMIPSGHDAKPARCRRSTASRWIPRLLGGALLSASIMLAHGQNPLQPADRSSPRAALKSFLDAGDAVGTFMKREYLKDPTRAEFHQLLLLGDQTIKGLDLSKVPPAARRKTGRGAAMSLYMVLSRIRLPEPDQIPDAEEMAKFTGTAATRWVIPHTEITLEQVKDGPDAGNFLFSPATVERTGEFYERVKNLPFTRPVPLEDLREIAVSNGGWMIPYSWIQSLPAWLRVPVASQSVWKWLAFLGILAVALIFLRFAYRLSRKGNPRHPFSRALARLMLPAYILAATPAVTYLALVQLNLADQVGSGIEIAATTILYLAAVWIAWRMGPVIAEAIISSPRISSESIDAHLIRICARLLGIGAAAGLIATGSNQLGLPVYGIVAGLGVGGVAIALAAQPTIENLIGGFSLFADKPVRVGDLCTYGTDTGTVESIGIRSTRIRGRDRSLTTIPNGQLSKMPIVSLTQRNQMLIQSTLGVRYETSTEQLRHLLVTIREMLTRHPKIDNEQVRVRLVDFGASSLDIELFAYVKTTLVSEFHEIREDILLRIMDLVEESGSGFAFPSQTLYFGRDAGLDRDRTAAAEEQVRRWREAGQLPFREFPEDSPPIPPPTA